MTARWACTILANSLIACAVFGLRPKHLRWLYLSQTAVLISTIWNVWAWYHLSDYDYNVAWTWASLAQSWCEAGFMLELLWNILHDKHLLPDSILASGLFADLLLKTAEFHSWLPFLNTDGWMLYELRANLGICLFPAFLLAVILHRGRYCAQEK